MGVVRFIFGRWDFASIAKAKPSGSPFDLHWAELCIHTAGIMLFADHSLAGINTAGRRVVVGTKPVATFGSIILFFFTKEFEGLVGSAKYVGTLPQS
jgi:hypothetical protein